MSRLEIKCQKCNLPIEGDQIAYDQYGTSYHPLGSTTIRVPTCVTSRELSIWENYVLRHPLKVGTRDRYLKMYPPMVGGL